MTVKADVLRRIRETGVIPVVRATTAEHAHALVAAIRAGGLPLVEITMTVPGAVQLIGRLVAEDDALLVGAGTVLDADTARACLAAGARFVVSPVLDPDTVALCRDQGVTVMPGALTPGEIVRAWRAGADFVKVYPASALGGPGYVASLKAALPEIALVPTGGVTLNTAARYLEAGAEAVGVGSDLSDEAAIRAGDAAKITAAARAYVTTVQAARR